MDVRTCAVYTNCSECMDHGTVFIFDYEYDPLDCGWCDGRCVSRDECATEKFAKSQCPPILYSVSHGSFPVSIVCYIDIETDS